MKFSFKADTVFTADDFEHAVTMLSEHFLAVRDDFGDEFPARSKHKHLDHIGTFEIKRLEDDHAERD